MELFSVGFVTVKLIDIIDIIIVSYIFYRLFNVMKGTIAAQIFIALTFIVGISVLAQALNFQALGWLLGRVTDIWVIAFIILFQPEIRRLLLIIGKTRFTKIFSRANTSEYIAEIVDAMVEMQGKGWGALIVIVKTTGLQNVIETGEKLDAKINKELLISIFNPKSPLHDGAVIINNNKIEAARCTLPLADVAKLGVRNYGTRHRAGVGITEESDAIALILSEERQSISVAEDGRIKRVKDKNELIEALNKSMVKTSVAKSVRTIFDDAEKSIEKPQKKKEESEK
ncbi:MAG: diadenylate cyclase CdaA [Ignavibacteria bacterium]|nr:diadenylate cyclase CdaA [Ignavibacteria bacterium]